MTRPRGGDRGVTHLVLDRAAIARMFIPGGMVYRWGRSLGREISLVAKGLLRPGQGYVTGELQRSVDSSVVPVGEGVQVNVRATARHALFYVLGTRPHTIHSERTIVYQGGRFAGLTDRGWMKFTSHGERVYAQTVQHPGFRGRNFLDEAKVMVLERRGISRV